MRQWKDKTKNVILGMDYRKKLFFSYFVICCLVLAVFSFSSSVYSSGVERQKAIYTAENMLVQTSEFISYKVAAIKNIMTVISTDDRLQTVIASSEEYDRDTQHNWMILTTTAKSIMYNANTSKDIRNVRLYALEGEASFESSSEFQELSEEEQNRWKERTGEEQNQYSLWIPASFFSTSDTLNNLTYIKKIPDPQNLNRYLGLLTATISKAAFENVITKAAATVNTSVLLFNDYGETIIYHGEPDFFTPDEMKRQMEQQNLKFSKEKFAMQQVHYKNGDYFLGIQPIENSDWTLATLTPAKDMLSATRHYQQQLFLIFLFLIVLSIPVFYALSRSLSARIQILKEHIAKAVDANFEIEPLSNGRDEIGSLTDSFNHMVKQISGLLKEQYELGYEIKNLEFQVLQSQINPHFLYNTLDMIYWMGVDSKTLDAAEAAKELARFYMLSLGHGEMIVSVQNELEHVRTYVNIQNMRFEGRFHLVIAVPEELYPYKMIKIILQPLVENALLHGIREKDTEEGTVTITGRKQGNDVVLCIQDDGVGMTGEQVEQILKKHAVDSGYGVWNIHERLQLSYGTAYGLEFFSVPGKGTRVFIRFPAS